MTRTSQRDSFAHLYCRLSSISMKSESFVANLQLDLDIMPISTKSKMPFSSSLSRLRRSGFLMLWDFQVLRNDVVQRAIRTEGHNSINLTMFYSSKNLSYLVVRLALKKIVQDDIGVKKDSHRLYLCARYSLRNISGLFLSLSAPQRIS